jgi:hypothetical protein
LLIHFAAVCRKPILKWWRGGYGNIVERQIVLIKLSLPTRGFAIWFEQGEWDRLLNFYGFALSIATFGFMKILHLDSNHKILEKTGGSWFWKPPRLHLSKQEIQNKLSNYEVWW